MTSLLREILTILLSINLLIFQSSYFPTAVCDVPEEEYKTDHLPLAAYIHSINPRVDSDRISRVLLEVEEDLGLPPYLLAAIAHVESHYNHETVGALNEFGMMQLHPKYHQPGETLEEHVLIAGQYLKYLLDRFGCNRLAIAAYNQGPTTPSADTRYVRLVTQIWSRIKEELK